MKNEPRNPIQPLSLDEHGVMRFKENKIVSYLLNTHPNCGMNELAMMDFSDNDREQFAQLIGYSLSGFSELRYVSDETYDAASAMSKDEELKEKDARIKALQDQVDLVIKGVKVFASVLGKHPDDIGERW